MAFAEPLVVPALTKHTATIVLLHGLGDNGASWLMLASNMRQRSGFQHVSFVFPHAPIRPISLNRGMPMPGWFDLHTLGQGMNLHTQAFTPQLNTEEHNHLVDEGGVIESSKYLRSLIDKEASKGIPASRVVIGGFSQGGHIAYFTGLTHPQKLGGVFGLSTYLLMTKKMQEMVPAPAPADGKRPCQETPVFSGHGTDDDIVPHNVGVGTSNYLKNDVGMPVEHHDYPDMDHTVYPEELDHLRDFLARVVPPLPEAS